MSDWKKDLQERFGDFREQEPEGLWSAIETEMASRKKRAVPLIWWASVPFAAALAALLILPGRGVFAPVSSSDEAYVEVVKDPGETPVSERMAEMLPAPESAPSAVPFVPSAVPSVSAASRTGVSTSAQASSEASPAQQAEERPVIEEAAGTPADPAPLSTDAAPETRASEEKPSERPAAYRDKQPAPVASRPARSRATDRRPVAVSMLRSSGSSAHVQADGFGTSHAVGRRSAAPSASSSASLARLLMANQPTQTVSSHEQPIRIGLILSYNFVGNWSVESGVFHSQLNSGFSSGTASVRTQTEQAVRCWGIPLYLRYDFLPPGGRFGCYARAGGSWEKAFSLERTETSFIGDKSQGTFRDTSRPDFSQWSVDAAAGVQLGLTRKGTFSLFAEPGISWHLPRENEIRTVYSEKPLSPSLTFGFRIAL